MERLSASERLRRARVARARGWRNIQRRHAAAIRRRLGIAFGSDREGIIEDEHRRVLIGAPASLAFDDAAFPAMMDFLVNARAEALDERKRIALDLRGCTFISPAVVPLLAAEMQRLRYFRGDEAVSGLSPREPKARRMLHATGFFDSMKIHDPFSEAQGDDLSPLYTIRSGTTLDGAVTKEIADRFAAALSLSDLQRERVQAALNEALENISEHAYVDKDALACPAESGRWWVSAIAANNQAYLLACDLGVTIPETVPATAARGGPANLKALADALKRQQVTRDEKMLFAAFVDGVTRRPDEKGGRGLGKMKDLLAEFDGGQLNVWSGKARAVFSKEMPEVETRPLARRFDGTYILWSLKQEPV